MNQPQTPPAVTNKPARYSSKPAAPSKPAAVQSKPPASKRTVKGLSRTKKVIKGKKGNIIYSCFCYLETFNFLDFLDEKK